MINYEIDPAVLEPLVPKGTALDFWNGKCLASVVGFQFLQTKVFGIAVPFHRNFVEVNLRFYVRRETDAEVRRGVVFVKEIVPHRAIAWTANRFYNERYISLPMAHSDSGDRVQYSWKWQGVWCCIGVSGLEQPSIPSPDSEASFVAEHYWGYVGQRDGGTAEYRVEHSPWLVQHATNPEFTCDVSSLYGSAFEPFLGGAPFSRRGLGCRGTSRRQRCLAIAIVKFNVRPFEIETLALCAVRRERLVGVAGAFPPQLE